ncbi:vomeronasal type-2 receptor 26-like [Pelodytes ibericus]
MTPLHKDIWHLMLVLLIPVSYSKDQQCSLPVTELSGMMQLGDIMIGVLLPIHLNKVHKHVLFNERPPKITCTMFYFENYQGLQAVRFALEEINGNPDLLPNITLGFQAYDSCGVFHHDLQGALRVLTGYNRAIPNYRCLGDVPLSSIIGPSISTHSITLAHILGIYRYPQVPPSVCSQSCPPGFWKATKKGEAICCFECVPCPQGEISNKTGSFNCLKCPWDMWPNPQKSRCLPKTIEYLSYEDPLGTMLTSTSTVSSLFPVVILKLFVHFKTTPVVKANNYSLSCLLLVSLSFCFLSSLAFIGYPQPWKCLLRQVVFGIVFALCISSILAKTIMVVFAFMATKPGSNLKKWTSSLVSYMIISICSLLQIVLCITWLSLAPPYSEMNTDTQPRLIILQCNEGSPIAFWCMLGYLGLLSTVSFAVAFLARRLPDNFNEAKFITFSMLAFLSVWISYIPASLSSQGKYTVAMEIFAILASSWSLVACMFAPKCFIILFRPNMNSREHLMRKSRNPVK